MKALVRKYWLAVLAVGLLLVAGLLSLVYSAQVLNLDPRLQAVVQSTSWVLLALQYLYSKSERFYVVANILRLRLTNAATEWDFTVELQDCDRSRSLSDVWEVIHHQVREAMRWHSSEHSLIANMPGYTLRVFTAQNSLVSQDHNQMSDVTCIQVSNLQLPFRTFKDRIEHEIIPLLHHLVEMLSPATEKYAAKIGFSSTNPYFGFFVRKLDLPKVVSFTCDLIETSVGGEEQTVTVRKDQIEIVTDNILALQTLSLKYVALATT